MKSPILIASAMLICNFLVAQPKLEFDSATINLERDENANKEFLIMAKVLALDAIAGNNNIKFQEISHTGTGDYFSFSTTSRNLPAGISSTSFPITILRGSMAGTNQTVVIGIFDVNGQSLNKTITLTISDPKKQKVTPDSKIKSDTSKWSIRIITGSNFDFFDTPTFKNFAGDLNIFIPHLFIIDRKEGSTKKPHRVGLQFGVFNFRYFEADSSRGTIQNEKYFLDPATRNPVVDTTQYIRDIYALDSKISYNNWGLYLNPMYELVKTDWVNLHFNLHFEVLWRTQTLSFNKVNIRKDTLVINSSDVLTNGAFASFPGIRSLYQQINFTDYYIGIGFPVKINIKNKAELFLNPTFGFSSFGTSIPVASTRHYLSYDSNETQPFFLGKFQLTTSVAPVDISLGGEYRKINSQKAFLGMYLGAAITLDKLKR